MTNAQSKFQQTVTVTCKDFTHPWTNNCVNATAGLLLAATPYCLRVYTIVYALSLLMRYRMPTMTDLKRTLLGIIQSTAFLVTNSFTFIMYNCLLRQLIGHYSISTVAFVPSFFASLTAILVERPARRPLLTLYVANVATEALWNMGVARGYLKSLPHAQTLVFSISITILLYMCRLGLHRTSCKDSIFNILRIFVGKTEEGPVVWNKAACNNNSNGSTQGLSFMQRYNRFMKNIKGRHFSCLHKENCISYCLQGGLKPLIGGIGLQFVLRLIINLKKIVSGRTHWSKEVFNSKTLCMGAFMGGFSFLYKSISCILRHSFGYDDARFALPAGLIASICFSFYPDNTVALYVMWKMLQIVYNYGADKGKLPVIPGFMLLLYSLCTATLFHSGMLEPKTLRPSYLKFLQALSGERFSKFRVGYFDGFGLNTKQNFDEAFKRLNIVNHSHLPKFPMVS